MGIIYLIGEEHDLESKAIAATEILSKLIKDIHAVTFEVESDGIGLKELKNVNSTEYKPFFALCQMYNLPIFAADKRNYELDKLESELENYLRNEGIDSLTILKFREVSTRNMKARDEYTSNAIHGYIGDKSMMHICGVEHMVNLKRLLEEKGHQVIPYFIASKKTPLTGVGDTTLALSQAVAHHSPESEFHINFDSVPISIKYNNFEELHQKITEHCIVSCTTNKIENIKKDTFTQYYFLGPQESN